MERLKDYLIGFIIAFLVIGGGVFAFTHGVYAVAVWVSMLFGLLTCANGSE